MSNRVFQDLAAGIRGGDALCILPALRFSSVSGIAIDPETVSAIHDHAQLLQNLAPENIYPELCGIVCGENVTQVLLQFPDVFSAILPELAPCVGFDQKNKYHAYTIYEHIARAVGYCRISEVPVRLALLLHDIGKPACQTEDANGYHFYGHSVHSYDLAKQALDRLHTDADTEQAVLDLVLYHDSTIEPTPRVVRRWLNKIGRERLWQLTYVREADILAHAPGTQTSRLERCYALRELIDQTAAESQRFSLKDLSINGDDLLSLGFTQGRELGAVLKTLCDRVAAGVIANDKQVLTDAAEALLK